MATAFRITAFGGIAPRMAARLLPDNMAQVANNLKRTSGEIRPFGANSLIDTPNKTMPPVTMYQARNGVASIAWFSWPTDVDVVRAPLAIDVESRFCWTGDGPPKYATFSRATLSGSNNYPSHHWTLGVPKPLTKPTVAPSGGTTDTVSRLYCYTFFSELGEESAPSPASDIATAYSNATWAISNMDAVPANSGGISAITYVGQSVTITADGNHFNRVGEQITVAGVTTVTNVNGTWTLTAINTATKTMTFTVTGTPSGTYNNTTDSGDTWTRVSSWNTTNMKRRLYRSAGTNATFQLVHDDVGTTYNDTLSDTAIMGDELISDDWLPPPVGLTGIKVHPSGALIGFVNNLLCMSEPSQPHAWPTKYQLSTDYNIVAVAIFGAEVAVGTQGNPYIASGTEPASMSMEKAGTPSPCLSKRGMISVGNGALYPSAHGMVFIGQGGVQNFTERHYSKDEWEALNPATMFAAFTHGRVYIVHTDASGNTVLLIFEGGEETTATLGCASLYVDESNGNLYAGTSRGIELFDVNDANPMTLSWRSKEFMLATPVNLGAAKIEFEQVMTDAEIAAMASAYAAAVAANGVLFATGDVGGTVNEHTLNAAPTVGASNTPTLPDAAPSNLVSFTLRRGEQIIYSRTVSSTKPFRLPAGLKYDHFSVEITTQNLIRSIVIGETVNSLRAA